MTTTDAPAERHSAVGSDVSPSGDEIQEIAPEFRRIDIGRSFPKARLGPTTSSGYLLLAAEVDRRPMALPNSRRKNALLRELRTLVRSLGRAPRVVDASLFEGLIDTPGAARSWS